MKRSTVQVKHRLKAAQLLGRILAARIPSLHSRADCCTAVGCRGVDERVRGGCRQERRKGRGSAAGAAHVPPGYHVGVGVIQVAQLGLPYITFVGIANDVSRHCRGHLHCRQQHMALQVQLLLQQESFVTSRSAVCAFTASPRARAAEAEAAAAAAAAPATAVTTTAASCEHTWAAGTARSSTAHR